MLLSHREMSVSEAGWWARLAIFSTLVHSPSSIMLRQDRITSHDLVESRGSLAVVSRLALVEIESVIAIKVRTGALDPNPSKAQR